MNLNLHTLKGCSPAPLANYLKALGILRLITEQGGDNAARGWWEDQHFCVLTKLSRSELEEFLLRRYEPTPLLSPWNKGSGFLKANDPGLAPIENSTAPRLARFRSGLAEARLLLGAVQQADAVINAIKARTKTNKSFQSREQRQMLKGSETFRACLDQLRTKLIKPSLDPPKRDELNRDIATIEALATDVSRPLTKTEANALSTSTGYKLLLAAAERQFKSLKARLIPECRRTWRGSHAEWLSAAVVLGEDGAPSWPSLFGTGGNDGRLDFTNNFMQRLGELFDLGSPEAGKLAGAEELLAHALWSVPCNRLAATAVGQFQPGAAGGANSSTGASGDSLVNAWDYVLMMEGSLLLSSRATRRLDPNATSRVSAPFAVHAHAAGFASPGSEKSARGEQWMPLWTRPATLNEVVALFGEARLQLNRKTASRPIDVARAVSRLGVARGIESFTRYGYLERNGQSTLAVPLGRVKVRRQPRAHLIDDLAPWLDRLQRQARDRNAPARLIQAERRLSDAVFAALTHDYSADRWLAILRAAVQVESLQAAGCAIAAGPIPPLNPEWIGAVGDTPAIRLAVSLASAAAGYTREGTPIDPVRHHWLPLEPGARRFKISDKRLAQDARVVMRGRDALSDLSAVVERRLIEATAKGERHLPLVAAKGCHARLDDIAAFLTASVDPNRVLDLARSFMAVRWDRFTPDRSPVSVRQPEQPGEAWFAIRLASLPWPLDSGRNIPVEPRMIRRLLAGNSAEAVAVALGRLKAAGIRPPLDAGFTDVGGARLWAAALAFPISKRSAAHAAHTLDPRLKGSPNV